MAPSLFAAPFARTESDSSVLASSGAVTKSLPRPLTEREEAVLAMLLSVKFPGCAELLTQARRAEVTQQWPGEATIALAVNGGDVPLAEVVNNVPVETSSRDDAFGILLHVVDGRLATLEIYSMAVEDLPPEFPPPSALRPPVAVAAA